MRNANIKGPVVEFLMYRVELKVGVPYYLRRLWRGRFLMYRVELKGVSSGRLGSEVAKEVFLMYTVWS